MAASPSNALTWSAPEVEHEQVKTGGEKVMRDSQDDDLVRRSYSRGPFVLERRAVDVCMQTGICA